MRQSRRRARRLALRGQTADVIAVLGYRADAAKPREAHRREAVLRLARRGTAEPAAVEVRYSKWRTALGQPLKAVEQEAARGYLTRCPEGVRPAADGAAAVRTARAAGGAKGGADDAIIRRNGCGYCRWIHFKIEIKGWCWRYESESVLVSSGRPCERSTASLS